METSKLVLLLKTGKGIASFIGSGINGNTGFSLLTLLPIRIASFIGSGINGNCLQKDTP